MLATLSLCRDRAEGSTRQDSHWMFIDGESYPKENPTHTVHSQAFGASNKLISLLFASSCLTFK